MWYPTNATASLHPVESPRAGGSTLRVFTSGISCCRARARAKAKVLSRNQKSYRRRVDPRSGIHQTRCTDIGCKRGCGIRQTQQRRYVRWNRREWAVPPCVCVCMRHIRQGALEAHPMLLLAQRRYWLLRTCGKPAHCCCCLCRKTQYIDNDRRLDFGTYPHCPYKG